MNAKQSFLSLTLGLFVVLFGVSCASVPSHGTLSQSGSAAGDQIPYLLGPDDVLRITVEKHPEWSGEFAIRPDGKILIPGLEELTVGQLTVDAVEFKIFNELEKYINNPLITVEIVRYASQVIYVLGEVTNPGRYSTEGKAITLRDAVILADLPTRLAADRRVYVITPRPRRPHQQVINLYRILYRGETQRNITIYPGDIVYVPPTILGRFVNFIGDIISPLTSTVPTAQTLMTPVP